MVKRKKGKRRKEKHALDHEIATGNAERRKTRGTSARDTVTLIASSACWRVRERRKLREYYRVWSVSNKLRPSDAIRRGDRAPIFVPYLLRLAPTGEAPFTRRRRVIVWYLWVPRLGLPAAKIPDCGRAVITWDADVPTRGPRDGERRRINPRPRGRDR